MLGRCRIGRPVGSGATATVFHATYVPLKRDVAVKILRPDAASSPEVRQRFIDEAKALAKLDHGNVVRVFDVVEDEGFLLIIMEFVEGRNVRQVVEEDGALEPEAAVETARQIALALDHAHGARILHRDVKPANVILREDGRAVLVDFGNAEITGEAMDRKGTALYVAPEVFQGKRQDEKSDTYSLGATLFHMLAGAPPYEGQSVQEILAAHKAGKLRSPSQVNPRGGIPKELDVLVRRAMAPTRGYRFAARDFAAELEGVVGAVRAGPKRSRERRPRARTEAPEKAPRHGMLYAGIGFAALMAGVLAYSLGSSPAHPPPKAPPPKPVEKAMTSLPVPGETTAPVGTGIDKRAETRAAREAAAAKALKDALDFAARNPDKAKAVVDALTAVASEYSELSQGMQAKEELRSWRERAMSGSERQSREANLKAEAEREAKTREEGLKRVSSAVAGMRFSEALGALQDMEPVGGKTEDWKHRQERLNTLIGFPQLLDEGLQGSPVGAYEIRTGLGKPGEKIVGATDEGLRMKSLTGVRVLPWVEVKPADVTAIGRKVLRNSPEPRIALAAFCWETDQRSDAKKEIDTALLTDRTGTFSGRVEELFGPEDER
jgi:serine/threonine protein kinase